MNIFPFLGLMIGLVTLLVAKRFTNFVLPAAVTLIGVSIWQIACDLWLSDTNPSPVDTLYALIEINDNGRLWSDATASLFRVTWGFFLAAVVGIPLGLWVG